MHPGVLPWRSLTATAATQLEQRGEALELAGEELVRARRLGLPCALGCALRVVGLLTSGSDGIHLLEEAATTLRQSTAGLAYARALVDLGAALRRSGQRAAARDPLGQGLRLAESFGAGPLRDQAEEELHVAGGRRRRSMPVSRSGVALTPTQLRVAQLAGQGLTNHEIAGRLQVNIKTVEWHLD